MSEDNKVNEAALPGKLLLLWQESDGAPQSRLYIGGREVGMITRIEVASPGVADGVPTLKEIGPILAGDVSVTWTQVGVPVYEGPVSGPAECPSQGWTTPFQAWLSSRTEMLIRRFGSVIPRKLRRVSVKALRCEWDAWNRAFMAHGIGIDEPCVGWVSEQGGE